MVEVSAGLPSLFSRYAPAGTPAEMKAFYAGPGKTQHRSDNLGPLNSASEDCDYGEPELNGADQVSFSLDPPSSYRNHSSASSVDTNSSHHSHRSTSRGDDHRLKARHGNDYNVAVSNRLHKFITKEAIPDTGNHHRSNPKRDDTYSSDVENNDEEVESLLLKNDIGSRARQRHKHHSEMDERRASREPRTERVDIASNSRTNEEGADSHDGNERSKEYISDDEEDHNIDSRKELSDKRASINSGTEDGRNVANSESTSGKRTVKALPLPSSAPPRRAKDALVEAEANQRSRKSIDEVLFKRDSKSESNETSSRNSVVDSSSDEEFDIKVVRIVNFVYFLLLTLVPGRNEEVPWFRCPTERIYGCCRIIETS
jgi:hypothetical protein